MGDSSDVLPSYFENGTAVFNVTDRDLSQFVKTIDKIESGGYVRGQGIFKVKNTFRVESALAALMINNAPLPFFS